MSSLAISIMAGFENDKSCNATAYVATPNGTQYAVCTTIHYGFKPSSNSTMLTVEPHGTTATTPTKTPEELQQEAENSGWLRPPEPEFSLWFPWVRLHFIGEYDGEVMIDVGVAILPFADSGFFSDTLLKEKLEEWMGKIAWSIFVGVIVTETALWLASHAGLPYFAFVLLGYIGYKFLMLNTNWNSLEGLWISLVSTFISTVISVWSGLSSFLPSALCALAASAANVKNLAFAFLCKLIMIPVNIFLLMMTWDRIVALGGV